MIDWSTCTAVERDPARGIWVLRGTRIPVAYLLKTLAGLPDEVVGEVVDMCPGSSAEQIRDVLAHTAESALTVSLPIDAPISNRYALAHWILPEQVMQRTDAFFGIMGSNHKTDYCAALWSRAESRTGYKALDFEQQELQVRNGIVAGHPVALLVFPWPTRPGEAYCAAAIRVADPTNDGSTPSVRYLVLEAGLTKDNRPCTYLCEWRDGKHLNYGFGPEATVEAFLSHLEDRLRFPENYVQQENDASAAQREREALMTVNRVANDPNLPYFEYVRNEMADIIEDCAKRGEQISIEEAYHRACMMSPQVSAGHIGQQVKVQEETVKGDPSRRPDEDSPVKH